MGDPASALALVTLPTGQTIGYGLDGAADVTAVVDGSTATYPEILPDADLELETLDDGLKETLVLNSAEAANSWLFPLRLGGLTAVAVSDGSVGAADRRRDDSSGSAVRRARRRVTGSRSLLSIARCNGLGRADCDLQAQVCTLVPASVTCRWPRSPRCSTP